MQAFHNDPKIKADLVAQLEAHYAADEIIKGTYWENGKGCAVGCCVHDEDHSLFPIRFGIPESIAYLLDGIFEALPNKKAKEFPLKLVKSIQVGADLSKVENLFLEWLLIDPVNGVSRFNSDPCIHDIAALHRRVADGDSVNPEEWDAARADWAAGNANWNARDAARAAARATWNATWNPTWNATWAATWAAARAAAWAAGPAAWAARAAACAAGAVGPAAWAAAYAAQAQKLIELLAAAPAEAETGA